MVPDKNDVGVGALGCGEAENFFEEGDGGGEFFNGESVDVFTGNGGDCF